MNSNEDYRDRVFRLEEEPQADRIHLYGYTKEAKYTDVILTFDDGTTIPCHRCVLASCSSYFDGLFSNGMRESRKDEIRLKDVSSVVASLAIEFVYTGRLTSTSQHFFELLLLANMYDLKKLETEILRRLVQDLNEWSSSPCPRHLSGDFQVDLVMFIYQYPVVAESLSVPPASMCSSASLKKFCLYRVKLYASLVYSRRLHRIGYDTLRDLLADLALIHFSLFWACELAFSWLKQRRMQEGPSISVAESPAFALLPDLLKELQFDACISGPLLDVIKSTWDARFNQE